MDAPLRAEDIQRGFGGVSLILAPLLLAAGELLRLSTGSDGTEIEVAGLTDDDPNIWIAVGLLEVIGVIVVFPGLLALLHVFRSRATSLGHLAIGLLVIGFVCQAAYAAVLAAANSSAARLTESGDVKPGDAGVALPYANALETPLVVLALVAIVTLLVGLFALANAVWKSRIFPRWTAIMIAAAPISAFAVDYGLPYLLLAIPWGWIGWRILRTTPTDWERLGVAESNPAAT